MSKALFSLVNDWPAVFVVVLLQIAVNEDFVEPTVNAIIQAGRSGPDGKIGDGKIFILPMDDCIRIRTGERGPEAI